MAGEMYSGCPRRRRQPPRALGNSADWGAATVQTGCLEAYTALLYAASGEVLPTKEGLAAEDLCVSAKFLAMLGERLKGDALIITRGIEDSRWACAWTTQR